MIACSLTLAACQTVSTPKPDQEAQWLSDKDHFKGQAGQLALLGNWHLSAKVGVATPERKETANLVWQFSDQANSVRLFGPLGVGAIRIEFDRSGVVLSDNKGVLHRGTNAEELLTKVVGWPIPVDALSHWLFAVPHPDLPYRFQLDDEGHVSAPEQQGWSIEYSDYKDYGYSESNTSRVSVPSSPEKQKLPRKLIATKQLGDQEQVVVRLITKSWKW